MKIKRLEKMCNKLKNGKEMGLNDGNFG